jgi:hypothetical protein
VHDRNMQCMMTATADIYFGQLQVHGLFTFVAIIARENRTDACVLRSSLCNRHSEFPNILNSEGFQGYKGKVSHHILGLRFPPQRPGV